VHNKGLSHRDIKPANIKLYKDSNQAMLIDFGW
jgi:serine/threonine protein kinase